MTASSSKIDYYQQRGDDFLKWVTTNKELLTTAIAKNTSFDIEIFNEIWGTALAKVYNAITKRHVEVTSLKNYTYTTLRWEYIAEQNRRRRYNNLHVRDYFQPLFTPSDEEEEKGYLHQPQQIEEPEFDEVNEKEDTPPSTIPPDIIDEPYCAEERYQAVTAALNHLRNILSLEFGEEYAVMFMDYMAAKSETPPRTTNYDDYAREHGYTPKFLGFIVKSAKQFVTSHPDFQDINKLISSYADN